MVGESDQNVFFYSDRRFEFRRIRDLRVRDIESRLLYYNKQGILPDFAHFGYLISRLDRRSHQIRPLGTTECICARTEGQIERVQTGVQWGGPVGD